AVTISVSTIISAVNALTMTPSRAVLIFQGEHGQGHKREALPWWIFGVLGGLATFWIGQTYLAGHTLEAFGRRFELPEMVAAPGETPVGRWVYWPWAIGYFLPGAIVGGIVGLLIIRPVNALLGAFFRTFNWGFDYMTGGYGKAVHGTLRVR